MFGTLPQDPDLVPIERTQPKLGQVVHHPYNLPQATLQVVYPGLNGAPKP